MLLLRIANGTVYDPANADDGGVKDLGIQDGKIVPPPTTPGVFPDRVIDATGLVEMPGGLEWYLLGNDPWRVGMSTDHSNGGSFLGYPQIVQLLMDRTYYSPGPDKRAMFELRRRVLKVGSGGKCRPP